MTQRWFTELHHGGLYHSLQLLSKRLDANLYRPIGEEWFKEGYWKLAEPYNNDEGTIKQFLSTEPHEKITFYCNNEAKQNGIQGLYQVQDYAHECTHEAITFELFKNLEFDVVICSYGPHVPSWLEMRRLYQPKAKFVLQVGNAGWEYLFPYTRNLLSSCFYPSVPDVANTCFYHQEFPLSVFKQSDPAVDSNRITSFVNCLPMPDYYAALANALPEYSFRAYGAGSPDGAITGQSSIAANMRDSKYGYHVKPGGDGYGHLVHNWAALGRPVITMPEHYYGKMGGQLLLDGETCIALKQNVQRDAAYVRSIDDDQYATMCNKMARRFREYVDFDAEEVMLRKFFADLQ